MEFLLIAPIIILAFIFLVPAFASDDADKLKSAQPSRDLSNMGDYR